MAKQNGNGEKVKSMEAWIWEAACGIRSATDVAKYKNYILPLENLLKPAGTVCRRVLYTC